MKCHTSLKCSQGALKLIRMDVIFWYMIQITLGFPYKIIMKKHKNIQKLK